MRSYRFVLEWLAFARLVFTNNPIVLVDFDFTLALHRKSGTTSGWDLTSSVINESVMTDIGPKKFYLFTARGYASYFAVSDWLRRYGINTKGMVFVGSTLGKIRTVKRLLRFSNKRVIWYDDLTDVNFDLTVAKNYTMNIESENLEFNKV